MDAKSMFMLTVVWSEFWLHNDGGPIAYKGSGVTLEKLLVACLAICALEWVHL